MATAFRLWYPHFVSEAIATLAGDGGAGKYPETPASTDPAGDARDGNLAPLFAIGDCRCAYKWLHAALDCGHGRANELIEDLLQISDLRYDDDRLELAAAHWELAVAYLTGQEGVARSLSLAEKHLRMAFETHDLQTISMGAGETYSVADIVGQLEPDARAILERALRGGA